MKELISKIQRVNLEDARNFILLDTCFVINILEHHKHIEKLRENKTGMTSFNIEELMRVEHKLKHNDKRLIRDFLKHPSFSIISIPVHPGDYEREKAFVKSIDEQLLEKVPDPSDAVLIAVAIKTDSIVLTKDKHHLFTIVLEEFLKKYGIKVYKDFNFLSE